jgi:cyclohexyl-isocyanide hydratase
MNDSQNSRGIDDRHLRIGSLVYDDVDQIDVTGPFEVLSRLPNATHRLYGVADSAVRDIKGLRIVPDAAIADAPQLDVLHVPGGPGQEALMDDEVILQWLRSQASGATTVLSVCTGALLLGAAGLLAGRRATTHWSAHHLLPLFGALPVNERVVRDGSYLFTAGVTAGIDGALRLVADLRGQAAAEFIQLYIAYAPEPPFDSGTPETAPPAVLEAARRAGDDLTARRLATARRVSARLGVADRGAGPSDSTR